MAATYVVTNTTTNQIVLDPAVACRSFWSHLKGLQFSRGLPSGRGLWFITGREGTSHTSIHMFFVFFSIGVLWVDASGRVVDKVLARPWRPFYGPKAPARDFIEALPEILDQVNVGDVLTFQEKA
ncbi:MAG: DUF192 domain-containing protein [Pleurocapsa minor GSE-CHR-MK-17-07R]|jgi:uncharacterized membrane protein (UPF0127 family)|nr:DUF192 domain-containing protein [Pleurocapsa minor GSE-CHR-MK 17-07R]